MENGAERAVAGIATEATSIKGKSIEYNHDGSFGITREIGG
jgi:hypothetical protein